MNDYGVARAVASLKWDLRVAARELKKGGWVTFACSVMLTLGIGMCAAAFGVAYSLLVRPVAWPEAKRLVAVLQTAPDRSKPFTVAPGVFLDWQARARSFDLLAGIWKSTGTLRFSGHAATVPVARVSADFWRLSAMRPALGRTFGAEEDRFGQPGVALIGAGLWTREFGGRGDVLGRTLLLDGKPRTVIGVLPRAEESAFLGDCEVWVPLAAEPGSRTGGGVVAVGRLRPGVTRQAAQAEMGAVVRQLGSEHFIDSKFGVSVQPFRAWVAGDARPTVLYLAGSAALLWLICCSNVSSLLLMWAAARAREMAVRASLGASRWRLASPALAASALVSVAGGVPGAVLALALVRKAGSFLPGEGYHAGGLVAGVTLLVACGLAAASALLAGAAPAWRSMRAGQGGFYGAGLLGSQAVRQPRRVRHALVAVQFALSLVLLCGTGLLGNSLLRLLRIDPGFARSGVLTVRIALPYDRYRTPQRTEFFQAVAERVRGLPQVRQTSVSDQLPLHEVLFPMELRAGASAGGRRCEALRRHVDTGYFAVLGVPLLKGREFEPGDERAKPIPAVLSESAAKALFGPEDPLGRPLTTSYSSVRDLVVVGVVRDTRQLALRTSPGPQVFLPLPYGSASFLLVKTAPPDGGRLAGDIRAIVFAADPQLPPPEIRTMEEQYWAESRRLRAYLGLLTFFAGAGLLVAVAGIYSLTGELTAARMREFGIRAAMGAKPGQILLLVLRSAAAVAAVGMAGGVLASLAVTRLLSSLLFEVRPRDPLTLALSALLLGAVAILAAASLARRAARLEPSQALRYE